MRSHPAILDLALRQISGLALLLLVELLGPFCHRPLFEIESRSRLVEGSHLGFYGHLLCSLQRLGVDLLHHQAQRPRCLLLDDLPGSLGLVDSMGLGCCNYQNREKDLLDWSLLQHLAYPVDSVNHLHQLNTYIMTSIMQC